MERWPSGLRRTLGKCVYEQSYRGFESHSLRHFLKLEVDHLIPHTKDGKKALSNLQTSCNNNICNPGKGNRIVG